ncbi:unnamed protein product, partial [Rodentolepis nana]|uniref:Uncharacterized protein n=1 Tax=Rodentolepis nana TaxID=102285 RepID=A0A0R3TH75_RODNA
MGSGRASNLIVNSELRPQSEKPRQRSMSIALSRLRSPGDLKIVPTNHEVKETETSTMVTRTNGVQTQNQSAIETLQ